MTQQYRTIVADPPWQTKRTAGWGTTRPSRELAYPTMATSEIAAMDVSGMASESAHLYLWAIGSRLTDAYEVAAAWGFRVILPLVWCKPVTGRKLGGLYTPTAEFCLFSRRGVQGTRLEVERSWFEWPRGAHSVKPAAFFDLVERVSPGPYLELFARRQRLGWDTWGDEALQHVEMSVHTEEAL